MEKHTEPIIKILIAHELTHVLQDQEIGLGKMWWHIKSLEKSEAFEATTEGHAIFVQELVGKQLNLDETVVQFSRLLAAGHIEFEEPILEMRQMIGNCFLSLRKP